MKIRGDTKERKTKLKRDIDCYKHWQREVKYMIPSGNNNYMDTTINDVFKGIRGFGASVRAGNRRPKGSYVQKREWILSEVIVPAKHIILKEQFKSVLQTYISPVRQTKGQPV